MLNKKLLVNFNIIKISIKNMMMYYNNINYGFNNIINKVLLYNHYNKIIMIINWKYKHICLVLIVIYLLINIKIYK